jgi:hypothetical protein
MKLARALALVLAASFGVATLAPTMAFADRDGHRKHEKHSKRYCNVDYRDRHVRHVHDRSCYVEPVRYRPVRYVEPVRYAPVRYVEPVRYAQPYCPPAPVYTSNFAAFSLAFVDQNVSGQIAVVIPGESRYYAAPQAACAPVYYRGEGRRHHGDDDDD